MTERFTYKEWNYIFQNLPCPVPTSGNRPKKTFCYKIISPVSCLWFKYRVSLEMIIDRGILLLFNGSARREIEVWIVSTVDLDLHNIKFNIFRIQLLFHVTLKHGSEQWRNLEERLWNLHVPCHNTCTCTQMGSLRHRVTM